MRVLPLYTHWVSCCRVVAKSIQALYNNFWLRPTWDTHPPYNMLGIQPGNNTHLFGQQQYTHNVWALYIHFRSLSRGQSTTLYPHHPHPTSTWDVASIIPIYIQKPITIACYEYNHNIDDLLINWFYLLQSYFTNAFSFFCPSCKRYPCQRPRPTTHLQAVILCP